jgi:hypothetical protein
LGGEEKVAELTGALFKLYLTFYNTPLSWPGACLAYKYQVVVAMADGRVSPVLLTLPQDARAMCARRMASVPSTSSVGETALRRI